MKSVVRRLPRVKRSPLRVVASTAAIALVVVGAAKLWHRSEAPAASASAPSVSDSIRRSAESARRERWKAAENQLVAAARAASDEAARAASEPPPAPTGQAALPFEPKPRPPKETICTETGCVGPKHAEERTTRLLAENPGRFSPEEIAILKAYSVDGLGEAVYDAEQHFTKATGDEERGRAHEYYRRVLNLVGSLSPPPHPVAPDEKRAYEKYATALRRAEPTLATMSPELADRERARIKESIFAELRPQQ